MIRLSRRELITSAASAAVLSARPAVSQAPQTIVLGAMQAVTGMYAFAGHPTMEGILLAAKELEAASFFAPNRLRLLHEDTASDRNQAITLLNRFATQEEALVVLGPTSSFAALATAPVANQLRTPMVTIAFSTEVLAAGPWSFKVTEAAEAAIVNLAGFAVEELGVRRAIAVFIRENDGYVRQRDAFADEVRPHGVDVESESVLASESDFTALGTKIATSGADCLFLSTPAELGANIIIQARQAGLPEDVRVIAGTSMATHAFVAAAGPMAEGVYVVADFVPGGVNDQGRAFVAAYTGEYGRPPDICAAWGYTKLMVVAHAINQTGPNPTRDGVRRALGQIRNFPVILGDGVFSMDENRVPHYGSRVLRIQDGKFVDA